MNSESDWAQAGQKFQQDLSAGWTKALQSFQGMGGNMPSDMPKLGFSRDKLEVLQQNYLKEAAQLWNAGLSANPASTDKRFAA